MLKIEHDLMPCPFCGAKPFSDNYNGKITIGCGECGFHGHSFNNLLQASQRWNDRVNPWDFVIFKDKDDN